MAAESMTPDSARPNGTSAGDGARGAVEEGLRLLDERKPLEARRALQRAVSLDRKSVLGWLNLGVACDALDDFDAARAAFLNAAGLDPDLPEAQHGLGLVAGRTGDFERAEWYLRNAISRKPIAGYYNNLSIVQRLLGRSAESDETLRRAVELAPDDAAMHSNLLLYLHYTHGDDGARMRAEHDTWARRHADPLEQRSRSDFGTRDRSRERRLRVGYVSPDFRLHSVAFFFEPLLMAHDPDAVELFCYSNVRAPDDVTRRIRARADGWREAHALDDDALTRQIVDDEIDILVDLAGHTGGNRLPVFARRAAPVQVNYLGYPGTTGLRTVDYRLTDAIADPAGRTDAFHSERLVRLTGGMLCYAGDRHAEAASTPPSANSGVVTFGSFNHLHKVTDGMLRVWAMLLERVPRSRLCIKSIGLANEGTQEVMRQRFAAQGGDPARIVLMPPEDSVASHLARYGEIDIAVDTFPFNGTTTTFEALWMGVPVMSLAGNTHVSRVSASILGHLGEGLEHLVATTDEEFVEKAVSLAGNRRELAELRRSLRGRLERSSVCDPGRLAKSVESAYRQMWTAWCDEMTKGSDNR